MRKKYRHRLINYLNTNHIPYELIKVKGRRDKLLLVNFADFLKDDRIHWNWFRRFSTKIRNNAQ